MSMPLVLRRVVSIFSLSVYQQFHLYSCNLLLKLMPFYQHMPTGSMLGIYHLLFVCLFLSFFLCSQHQNRNGQLSGEGVGCHAMSLPLAVMPA